MIRTSIVCLVCSGLLFAAADKPAKPYSRETVRHEILQALHNAEKAREEAILAIRKEVKEIESLRAGSDEKSAAAAIHHRIVEAESVADIAETTAEVEKAKIKASVQIAHAVDKMERLKASNPPRETLKQAEYETLRKIAHAVAYVEKVKAHATKKIVDVTVDAEKRKTQTPPQYVDPQAKLLEARSHAESRIAASVASVEVMRALAKAEMLKELPAPRSTDRIDIDKVEAKAKARIAKAIADAEKARSKAMAEIADAVATVKAAQWANARHPQKVRCRKPRGSYPNKFIFIEK